MLQTRLLLKRKKTKPNKQHNCTITTPCHLNVQKKKAKDNQVQKTLIFIYIKFLFVFRWGQDLREQMWFQSSAIAPTELITKYNLTKSLISRIVEASFLNMKFWLNLYPKLLFIAEGKDSKISCYKRLVNKDLGHIVAFNIIQSFQTAVQ